MNKEFPQRLVALRRNHPAWLLLASRNGPLTLSCLQALIEHHPQGIPMEDAVEHLAGIFSAYANDSEFDTGEDENHHRSARREIRMWINRGLITERDGQIMATDALQRSLGFLNSLEDRAMTSTASRLGTVQREIEMLEERLNPNQAHRAKSIEDKIELLGNELSAVKRGDFEVLDGPRAEEGIREVYQLALSLQADFRRVEDSYREADLSLRQKVIGEQHHRGEIVDQMLTSHETLVNTVEGQVFEGFYRQLVQTAELESMKTRLRSILDNTNTDKALDRKQKKDLRELVSQLVNESQRVIQARARSERDVRGFLKSGLADEQLRVGAILQDLFRVALEVDWQTQAIRRSPGPFLPIGVAIPNLPVMERFRIKEPTEDEADELDFSNAAADPTQMDDEFWRAYQALDRAELFESTLRYLKEKGKPVTLAALANALPPTHDLETIAYWLAMAREAGIEMQNGEETFDLMDEEANWTRFYTPLVELTYPSVAHLNPEEME